MKRHALAATFMAATLGMGGAGALVTPSMAGPEEHAMLLGFIGDWRGEGALVGGDRNEPFRCRLSITQGNQSKINYAGRCSLANMNLSVSGTIAYSDQNRRYEAAMSSNAGFTGMAVGQQRGGQIVFDLSQRQEDQGGNDVAMGSRIFLIGENITVEFQVEFNDSGDILTATVPFAR